MKLIQSYLSGITISCLLLTGIAHAELTWLEEESVSQVSSDSYLASAGFGTNHSGMGVDSNNIPHITWFSGSPSRVYYANRTDGTWNSPIPVTAGTEQSRNPSIAIDSTNRLHLAWHDYRNGGIDNIEIYYNTTTVGGAWNQETRLTHTVDVNNTNGDNSYCPTLLAEPSGKLHLNWYDFHWNGWRPELAYKSAANWYSWDTSESIDANKLTDSQLYQTPYPAMSLGEDGFLHLVWTDDESGFPEIYYMQKTAGSSSWTPPLQLSFDSTTCKFPAVISDPSGNVYVFWDSRINGLQSVKMRKYDALQGTWLSTETVTTPESSSNSACVSVDKFNTVHLVWSDNRTGISQVYYRSLSVTGIWSDELLISNGIGIAQYPEIKVDSGNNLHCIWQNTQDGYSRIFYRCANNSTGIANWVGYPWE